MRLNPEKGESFVQIVGADDQEKASLWALAYFHIFGSLGLLSSSPQIKLKHCKYLQNSKSIASLCFFEKDFVLRFIGRELYWIGFQREDVDKPWKLPDGSLFSNW